MRVEFYFREGAGQWGTHLWVEGSAKVGGGHWVTQVDD